MNRDKYGRFCKKSNKNSCKYTDKTDWGQEIRNSGCCCKGKITDDTTLKDILEGTDMPSFETVWKGFCDFCTEGDKPTAQDKKDCEKVYEEVIKELYKDCPEMFGKTEPKTEKEKLLDNIESLLDTISESAKNKKDPETLEELLLFLDRNIDEMKALKVAVRALLQVAQECEEKSKGKKKGCKKKLPEDTPKDLLEFIKEKGIPVEDIKACGVIDLDTGESWKKEF